MVFPRAMVARGAPGENSAICSLPTQLQVCSAGNELPEPVGKSKNLSFYPFSSRSPRTHIFHLNLADYPAFPYIFPSFLAKR